MAGSYGSAARPANLGPFRRIVGVHWRKDDPVPAYLAVAMRLKAIYTSNGTPETYTALRYWEASYPPAGHPEEGRKVWSLRIYREGDGWTASVLEGAFIDGLPDYGSYLTYLSQGWYWPPLENTDLVDNYRWRDPGGAEIMPTPGGGSTFKAGSPVIERWKSGARVDDRMTISPTTATHMGRIYNFVGAAAVWNPLSGADNILIGGPGNSVGYEMWLLFHYDPPTS